MIPTRGTAWIVRVSKPRASGDDPDFTGVSSHFLL